RDVEALQTVVEHYKPVLVLIDPAYQAFPPGVVGNLFAIGRLLARFAGVCSAVRGCTGLFLHHANHGLEPGPPMQLDDLLWSGFAEWSRQWLLVNRHVPFDPATPGRHDLLINYGGSAGHCGGTRLLIDEGTRQQPRWDVQVLPLNPAGSSRTDNGNPTETAQV